jgi:hypothetical protein
MSKRKALDPKIHARTYAELRAIVKEKGLSVVIATAKQIARKP